MASQVRLRIASADVVPSAYVDFMNNQIASVLAVYQLPDPGSGGGGSGSLGTVLNADGITFTDFDAVDNANGTFTDPFAVDNGDGTMTMGS
jgi:hypothetical protein